jgi:hypothetical protein
MGILTFTGLMIAVGLALAVGFGIALLRRHVGKNGPTLI